MSREAVSPAVIFIALLVILGGSGALYYKLFAGKKSAVDLSPVASSAPPSGFQARPSEGLIELPGLDVSDALVRNMVAAVSSHPELATWLATDGLVRRFVVVVDNVARGESPRTHVPFMSPNLAFEVSEQGDGAVIDEASYARYDTLTEAVASLDTAGCLEAYRKLAPLMESAYQELGYPDGNFEAVLESALRRVLATPEVEGAVEVRRQRVSSFAFADERLESLDPVAKHFLRLGPDNRAKVRAKLRELASGLGLGLGLGMELDG